MIVKKAFKYRLEPTSEQRKLFAVFAGHNRFVWNRALALQKESFDRKEGIIKNGALEKMLVAWKKEPETEFLKEAHSQTLQQTLKHLDRALWDAFDKEQPHKQFPAPKKKGKCIDSFRFPQGIEVDGNRVKLPKIGWVKYRKTRKRKIVGEIRNATVSRRGDHWYVSVQTQFTIDDPVHQSNTAVGGDMGIKIFLALSDGTTYDPLNSFKKLDRKLARAQRKLARMQKFSTHWKKQKRKITRIHEKIANCRLDHLHKISTEISKNHAVIALEDLRVKNMSASAKGTVDNPGCNVKQKSGLNRSILDQGWGMFRGMVAYKQERNGGQLILVDPAYSSQECSAPGCGHVAPENRKTQALFICEACGFTKNADVNAAGTILNRAVGHTVQACGGIGLEAPDEAGTTREAA